MSVATERPPSYRPMSEPSDVRAEVPCGQSGCRWGSTRDAHGRIWFIHETSSGFSMLEIPEPLLADLDYDLWDIDVKPWIERLHREQEVPA